MEEEAGFFPLAGVLEGSDGGEVEGVEDEGAGVETLFLGTDVLVYELVVGEGGFPAHAAEEADCFHSGEGRGEFLLKKEGCVEAVGGCRRMVEDMVG